MTLADATFSRIALKCKGALDVIVHSGDRLSSIPVVSILSQVLVFSTIFMTISGYGPAAAAKLRQSCLPCPVACSAGRSLSTRLCARGSIHVFFTLACWSSLFTCQIHMNCHSFRISFCIC